MKRIALLFLLLLVFITSFLRLYKITTIPEGLYVDEASVAYNAYSILKTGKDEHGVQFPFAFQAFGEYKMPVFIYLTSFSIALFGKNEFAIRIPSAFFGILTVVVFYFFAKELILYEKTIQKKYQEIFAFVSAFLLAFSPWHLQFSRAGFEAIVALFFFLLGLLFFLYFYRKRNFLLLFLSFSCLIFSMYSYNAFRIIGLLSAFCLFLLLFFRLPKEQKSLQRIGLLALLLALPMILFSFTTAGQARFMQVNAFIGPGGFFLYPLTYLTNYLAHFSFSFLFSYGDGIGRHLAFRTGALFKWELIPLLFAIYLLLKEKKNFFIGMVVFLLLVSPVAAAVALPSPHVLRSLPLVIPITLLVSYGLTRLLQLGKMKQYLLLAFLSLIAIAEFVLYVDNYYNHAAVTLMDWGGQYKELLTKLAKDSNKNTVIFVNDTVGMNYVYAKFYQPQMTIITVGDTWVKPASLSGKHVLYVTAEGEKIKNTYLHVFPHTRMDTITTPDRFHNTLYTIWQI